MDYLQPRQKTKGSSVPEQTMSSQEHLISRISRQIENGGYKNPQRVVSFKSHVAFYHIVSNEVLP